jgi:hypothetical protein
MAPGRQRPCPSSVLEKPTATATATITSECRAVVTSDADAVLPKVSLNAKLNIGRKVDRLWAAIWLTKLRIARAS